MDAYIRKIFEHDLTHEISITNRIVQQFFNDKRENLVFRTNTEEQGFVSINDATDPRLGGDFKRLCGELKINDYIVIIKSSNNEYKLFVISKDDPEYPFFSHFFPGEKDRHSILFASNTTSKIFILPTPTQVIYYGVPGCGKSQSIKKELEKKGIPPKRTKRVVFHPDYSHADFIGQILPESIDGKVQYKFSAGPFSQILREAYGHPEKEYALIIEEINRGNAAAIFGDLFQLLDRKTKTEQEESEEIPDTGERNFYGNGWSDYCVSNDNINAFFRESENGSMEKSQKLGSVTVNAKVGIRLPPNLSLYATMNTSDQNVFPLDNAFQRRWKMKLVPNDLGKDSVQYKLKIENTGVVWGKFRESVNQRILEVSDGVSSLSDKRLGGYFITPENVPDNSVSKSAFADKVIKYLYDDAFKFNREIFKDGEKKSLEQIIEEFNGDSGFGIFEDSLLESIQSNGQKVSDD